jgi:hypothetical protein
MKRTLVGNSKLWSLLFAIAVVLHMSVQTVSQEHPTLAMLLSMLEMLIWIILVSLGIVWLFSIIQQRISTVWSVLLTFVHTHIHLKIAKNNDLVVPVEQLEHLRDNVQRLGLALHGMTPEMEMARRTHFLMLGEEEAPPLILPPQNACLYAEFESLVKVLNHFGFPFLEGVRLQKEEFAFLQQWRSDLEARLHQHQKRTQEQQTALCAALTAVMQQHKTLGEIHACVHNDSGYHQIQGALRILENMAYDQRCSWDLAQICVQQLQSGLDILKKQCEQAVNNFSCLL